MQTLYSIESMNNETRVGEPLQILNKKMEHSQQLITYLIYYIIEITALKRWLNKSLSELRLRNKYGVNVLAIKRGNVLKISPAADEVVKQGDILVVIGDADDIGKIESQAGD